MCIRDRAQSGLGVALTDRTPVVMPQLPLGPDDWDSRVYAISPGSAAFLRGIGTWQHLGCDRVQAVESMLIHGDRGGCVEFTADELGERALAWIVEERSLRAGLVPLVRTGGVEVLA